MATITILAILISQSMAVYTANANPHVFFPDRPNMTLPIVTVQTPAENGSYPKDSVFLDFNVTKPDSSWFWGGYGIPPSSSIATISYTIDGNFTLVFSNNDVVDHLEATSHFTFELGNLTGGKHTLLVFVSALHFYGGMTNTPLRQQNSKSIYVTFNVDEYPPTILNLSVENKTYTSPDVELNFEVENEPSWTGYSLDGQENVTVPLKSIPVGFNSTVFGNATLTNMSTGIHSIVVYSNNTSGTMCKSDMVFFTVSLSIPTPTPSPSPSPSPNPPASPSPTIEPTLEPTQTASPTPIGEPIIVAYAPQIEVGAVVLIFLVAVGILVYFKRRKG